MKKAVVTISGGLDSLLAARIIIDLGFQVTGVSFSSPFFPCESPCWKKELVRQIDIPLKVITFGQEYIDLLKAPKYGYGKNMNPCVDCHIYMFRKAGEYMREIGAEFVATGEVLGQRPKSQRRDSLRSVERDSGLDGYLLRPLSAKLLDETIPEKKGIIDRTKLYDIQGRSRARQMQLVEQFRIENYSSPGGGCLLTDPLFSKRLAESFDHGEGRLSDMEFLRFGRHFRLPGGIKFVLGRDYRENCELEKRITAGHITLEPEVVPGPTCLFLRSPGKDDLMTGTEICAGYSKGRYEESVSIVVKRAGKIIDAVLAKPSEKENLRNLIIM